ncbi:hypothetical protein L843_0389 [Mycobacterium intracellulare MIN_061107_1834]|nr:hypothetical protein L843_0389 [Mycobacterium intracellulare MIN_061107_1834]
MPVHRALRPQHRRRGLFRRKHRDEEAQQQPRDSRDRGHRSWDALRSLITVVGHEARS